MASAAPRAQNRPPRFQILGSAGETEGADNAREFQLISLGTGGLKIEVMIYGQPAIKLVPLLIVHSIDFPIPPSSAFCETFRQAGFQIIFVRRPGFGQTSMLPGILLSAKEIDAGTTQITEAIIVNALIETLNLNKVLVLSFGTAAPICARMGLLNKRINLCIFANPAFNQSKGDGFRTSWIQQMVEEVLICRSGAHLAAQGFKFQLKRNHQRFYELLLQRSDGDLSYIDNNRSDCEAASIVLRGVTPGTLFYQLRASLRVDPLLKDGAFEDLNAVVLQGTQTTEKIASHLKDECRRLAVPIEYDSTGYRLLPYTSSEFLLGIIQKYAG